MPIAAARTQRSLARIQSRLVPSETAERISGTADPDFGIGNSWPGFGDYETGSANSLPGIIEPGPEIPGPVASSSDSEVETENSSRLSIVCVKHGPHRTDAFRAGCGLCTARHVLAIGVGGESQEKWSAALPAHGRGVVPGSLLFRMCRRLTMTNLILQTGPYIPRTDEGKRTWFNNLARLVSIDPEAYDLTEEDTVNLTNLAERFAAAYQLVQQPSERTTSRVRGKNEARKLALEVFRRVAMFIKYNPAIDDDLKGPLGLHLDDPALSRLGSPQSAPTLYIVESAMLRHKLRYADRETPSRAAKPAGAQRLELFVEITAGKPTGDPRNARYLRSYSKQPFWVIHDEQDGSRFATYYGRWATNTGAFGPWSAGVTLTIPTSGLAESAMSADALRDGASRGVHRRAA